MATNPYLYPTNRGGELPPDVKHCFNNCCSIIIMVDLWPYGGVNITDEKLFKEYDSNDDMQLFRCDIESLINLRRERLGKIQLGSADDFKALVLLADLRFWEHALADLRVHEHKIRTLMN